MPFEKLTELIKHYDNYSLDYVLKQLTIYLEEDKNMIFELFNKARTHFTEEETKLIIKSFLYAYDLHRGIKRASGEPYITHPVRVAYILLDEMCLRNANSICAALLHDTIEDTGITKEFLEEYFNADIANLVASVSKIKDLDFTSKSEEEQYNTCVLIRGLMNDYRVILLKLADRLHNMRTLEYKQRAKQKEKSKETLALFVPLAERVGALKVEKELKDLALQYLNNHKYRELKANINNYKENHQKDFENILNTMEKVLLEHNINHDIRIETKGIYDTLRVLKPKEKLASIPDLIRFLIVVDSPEDCYLALCYLESVFHPIDAILRNYISNPKPNGYQAILTVVNGFQEHPVEFRICTKKMQLVNNYGLAVLGDLKPNKTIEEIKEELHQNNKFINALKDIDDLYKKDDEFMRQVTEEILSPQVRVYSKDGEMISLPKGATVLDFAYKIHSKIGDQAISAFVNNKPVLLSYVLKDLDSIQVLTNDSQLSPDKDALNYVVTALAKKKIRNGPMIRNRRKGE